MFAPESITSPDSFVAPSRESTKTTLLIASSSSSRQSGRHAPTALTWQPGFSHNPFSTGVFEFVAVTITSAPLIACSTDVADVIVTATNSKTPVQKEIGRAHV